MDPAFGWEAAKTLARDNQDFPACVDGKDNLVFRAFLHNASRSYRDDVIRDVVYLTAADMKMVRATIDALLLTDEGTPDFISKSMGLDPDVIAAYEKLFFNVRDRRADEAYLAATIYPNGRLVEMYSTYLDEASFGALLRRTARSCGAWDVLYMAGYTGGLLQAMQGNEVINQLESVITLNGLIIARNGWLNQQTTSMGLHHARSILTAAKMAGQDTTAKSPMRGLGATLASELLQVKGQLQKEQVFRKINKARAAQVIDITT